MREIQRELINRLAERRGPATSQALAEALGVSVRTVKSYVAAINDEAGRKVILSGRSGYALLPGGENLPVEENHGLPRAFGERARHIVLELLVRGGIPDVFDLCETLRIGYSTLKSDIAGMNDLYHPFRVRFFCRNNALRVDGGERDLRRLISHVVFEECGDRLLDLRHLERDFHGKNVKSVSQIVKSAFENHACPLGDFAHIDLVLHLLVIAERVGTGSTITSTEAEKTPLEIPEGGAPEERALTRELIRSLEHAFGLAFPPGEREQIRMLVRANATNILPGPGDDLKRLAGEDALQAARTAAEKVREIYGIDLMNDRFLPPFALHLGGLRTRIAQRSVHKNPLMKNLKKDCRTIYDIAVCIAIALENHWNVHIDEDETAFFALHVGAELERQRNGLRRLRCALLCPEYRDIGAHVREELLRNFGGEIEIAKIVSQPSEVDSPEFDLLFATVDADCHACRDVVRIAPFGLEEKRSEIERKIAEVRLRLKQGVLRENFDLFFDRALFYVSPAFGDRETLFEAVCGDMLRLGYVGPEFIGRLRERESASSTAFGALAVPHSIRMDALKSRIAVVLDKGGIRWGEGRVHVALLTAINRNDRFLFSAIYDALISVFDDPELMENLQNLTDFEALRTLLTGRAGS